MTFVQWRRRVRNRALFITFLEDPTLSYVTLAKRFGVTAPRIHQIIQKEVRILVYTKIIANPALEILRTLKKPGIDIKKDMARFADIYLDLINNNNESAATKLLAI